MKSAASVAVAVGLVFGGQLASAQDLARYRDFVLGTSLEAVVVASGASPADARTIHERPATIQQVIWRTPMILRTPNLRSGELAADPVRRVAFSFYNDGLYQVVVDYDRQRTAGLTNSDVVESLSAAYGPAVLASAKTRFDVPSEGSPGSIVVARWQGVDELLTLLRAEAPPEFQLILESKSAGARARDAIRESIRMDTVEAPRRERERLRSEASDAAAERDRARVTNKAAFRP